MKVVRHIFLIVFTLLLMGCKDNEIIEKEIVDPIGDGMNPVYQLKASKGERPNEIHISWNNPTSTSLYKVEIQYKLKEGKSRYMPNPILLDGVSGSPESIMIEVSDSGTYIIEVRAISISGIKSSPARTEFSVNVIQEVEQTSLFLSKADTLMTSLTNLCFGGNYDVWNSGYPNATGPFWGGAAAVWGQGSGFSAYVAIRRASSESASSLRSKYASYDDRFFTSIEKFVNTMNGTASSAYGTYLGGTDERYYDDNVWIGIDMADLYVLTNQNKYLDRAKMVWNFIQEGTDDVTGGGVYWKEGSQSKHTCSTAPGAVLSAKLYQITNEPLYLERAIEYYTWCKDVLQDPKDFLYWDNARLENPDDPTSIKIETPKYSYNSGQPMQAAALLYNITGDSDYLVDAQNIAQSAYAKWFIPFKSYVLNKDIHILDPSHTWFQAIMMRGFVELYNIDGDRKYITAFENSMSHAWGSNARDKRTNFISGDFRGGQIDQSWDILHQGACVEMLARLSLLEDK